LFINMRRAASWGHPRHEISVPLGALTDSMIRDIVSLYCRMA
jgi:hypothetical protein